MYVAIITDDTGKEIARIPHDAKERIQEAIRSQGKRGVSIRYEEDDTFIMDLLGRR
jgi:hypothetical protein